MFAAIRLILILVILAALGGAAWYITGLRGQLAVSEAANTQLQDSVIMQQEVIKQIKEDVEKVQKANETISESIKNQNKDLNSLQNRFNVNADGSTRDIGKIAITNTNSIERAINRGTINAARCIEIASGAPLTEEERNAKTKQQINKECPSIANPGYKP